MKRLLCPTPSSFSARVRVDAQRDLDARFVSITQEEFERRAPDYDAVLIRFQTRIDEKVMGPASRLSAVLSPTTGLDHIDLDAANRHGVRVFHLRNQRKLLRTVSATAELTVALMLALMRGLPDAIESVRAYQWETAKFRGTEAAGKTIGIVGYGRLGSKVSRVSRALGMNVIAYDVRAVAMPAYVMRCESLNQLLGKADIVSIHVPLADETRGLIGKAELQRMKKSALLVNTARAAIVDQRALLSSLRAKHLGGGAVDVLEEEHFVGAGRHPMIDYARRHSNLLITPHIGGATEESIEKTDMNVLRRYLQWIGRPST